MFAAINDTRTGAIASRPTGCPIEPMPPKIFVVEDEYIIREGICTMIRDAGWDAEAFASCEAFLKAYRPRPQTCLVLDVHFAGMGGLELLGRIGLLDHRLPVVIVSGSSQISEAVQSMKDGASDFIQKPIVRDKLLTSVRHALKCADHSNKALTLRDAAADHVAGLTERQRQIMELVLAGQPSKNIAADLGISQRTVENHRAEIMHKTGAHSLPALSRLVMCHRCSLAT
jgi:two-component system CheB/CheR fusion protein